MSYAARQKHTPEQWLEAQSVSGQSQAAFCAEHGLSKSSFQHWKRRLTATGRPVPPPPVRFAPLAGAPAESDNDWTIELEMSGGGLWPDEMPAPRDRRHNRHAALNFSG